ncbi:MAG: hypothetical protein GTO12_06990 [Proteobacteria bacterium]|nr:hypothetical protein [Pseudomonadota bacterium]
MGKWSRTWSLMGASWQVLKKDKEMLIFPLLSGVSCLLVLVSFAFPLYTSGRLTLGDDTSFHQLFQRVIYSLTAEDQRVDYYLNLFLFYFCNYFVISFFNSAIIACARIRMGGGDPTVSDGFRAAVARLPLIAGWALVSATAGLILRIIEDRSEWLGKLVAGLLGMAWTVISFLVIPIMVIEKKGPITALKESTRLLRKTWGEQLIGNFSFGLVFFVISIPAFLFIAVAFQSVNGQALIYVISLAVIYFIFIALIQSTLQAIFQAAIYLYARDGQIPEGFQSELLKNAMAPR